MEWNTPLTSLYKSKKIPNSTQLLINSGIHTLNDLLWIFPLRVLNFPEVQNFEQARVGEPFTGKGTIENISSRPNFSSRGKFGARLYNISAEVKDSSGKKLSLKWFNAYPTLLKKIEGLGEVEFFGIVSEWKGQKQIISPRFNIKDDTNQIIDYPTINSVSGNHIKKIFDKIPDSLWDKLEETLPGEILKKRNLLTLGDSFKVIHGKLDGMCLNRAKDRIIYQEFFQEQLKIYSRKLNFKSFDSKVIKIDEKIEKLIELFPYTLTECQMRALEDIFIDYRSNWPMMRLLQGDVGCGKTSVAFIAMLACAQSGFQSALMCPTESLAYQHFLNFSKIFKDYPAKLLLGSTKEIEKKEIRAQLKSGELQIIIGTHALISPTIEFFNPGLFVIDEQHKFGVDQRLELVKRYPGTNTLIMSATPIPRSLSLTKYGDLSLSKINKLPHGRKNIKTKIVTKNTFEQFLKFLNTRVSMGEQAYLVVPAINESDRSMYLDNIFEKFKTWFPNHNIAAIHGQMPFNDRTSILKDFLNQKVSILVATSVIEVGIDVKNSTIMAIFSPELFGLSSLHQLRGRVGRGQKQSFCFLINLSDISSHSLKRLKIIEKTTDGFEIAEADLMIRGEGDHFGVSQSGHRKLANIVEHEKFLIDAKEDLELLIAKGDQNTLNEIKNLSKDLKVFSTI